VYHAALGLSGQARVELLDRSDPLVREAVDAMLAQEGTEMVLDRPAWEQASSLLDPPAAQMAPGEQVGPYVVEAKIGAGGMGEVYRARDTRLDRLVAIKVSAAQFSQRFEREAKAIAALSHPNICQIFDIGPNYLVMEHIDGLPVVSDEQAPLRPAKALLLATQIAAALEAAHAKGIIHRDLKPANILATTSGVAKLLDFGLAKRSPTGDPDENERPTTSMTGAGTIIGSPAYMSPEQAEGKTADARSDIFSFGTVLYEMLAGHRAFPGRSAASTLGAIIHKNPDPLNAPPALNAIVFKCLAKSPGDRFQSATDLLTALERASAGGHSGVFHKIRQHVLAVIAVAGLGIGTIALGFYLRSPTRSRIDSIAVLPLDIRSTDPDADYISDGITETVNNSLARLPGLKVIPHSVALHYKGKALDLQKVGAALNVQAVLTGRVAQRGEDVTIGVELDDVRNGKQLWGQQYTRQLSDLLAMENSIAREVSQRLRSQLSEADQQKLTLGSTSNPEAYQLYLKGQYFTYKFTKDGFRKGIQYLNQAIALDPNYAQAYSALANNYINQDDWFMAPREAGPKAREAAKRALALDEGNVHAHVALAIEAQWYEWDWAASEREFKRALELNPDDGSAHGYYAWFLPSMGRVDQAVAEGEKEQQTDPLGTNENFTLGSVFVFTRQWDKAIHQLRSAIELDPNYWLDHCFLGRALEQKGRLPEAIAEFQRGLALDPDQAENWAGLGHAYALSGNRAEAQKAIDQLKELSARSYIAPYNMAVIYAGLGEKDRAFSWLERAYADRSYLLALYLTTDARLDTLHSDPRFSELRRRIGLPALDLRGIAAIASRVWHRNFRSHQVDQSRGRANL
jgi:serine/threonine protein kinase/tetratricopeptide (TPR) repeat protein